MIANIGFVEAAMRGYEDAYFELSVVQNPYVLGGPCSFPKPSTTFT